VKRVMLGYIPGNGIFRSPVTVSLSRRLLRDLEEKENTKNDTSLLLWHNCVTPQNFSVINSSVIVK
jgi:hypothetical protein